MTTRSIAPLAALALIAACASSAAARLTPASDALAPWTVALRDSQPEGAYAAVYAVGDRRFVFVAAEHATQTDSLTFQVIDRAYDAFRFDTVIVEGYPTSRGENSERLLDYAREAVEEDGFQPRGETVPTVLGALASGATVIGGELDDAEIGARLVAAGYAPEDVLGFYTMRTAPQWVRERKIVDGADPGLDALLAEELDYNRQALGFDADLLATPADWRRWYAATNGKPMDASFALEETGPLADGPFATNAISAAIGRTRDAYLHEMIIARLNAGERVLVVFGASHYLIHAPALEAALGAPCFLGADLAAAPAACAAD